MKSPLKLFGGAFAAASAFAVSAAAAPVSAPADQSVDFRTLDAIVGDATTVVLGEDSHEMAAIHALVPKIFEHLVTEKGFRVFVFEAQWALPEGLADFMASDRTELNGEDSYWLNGAFASQPVADMLVWIRNWNRTHPDDPIILAGYQPENPVSDFRGLFAFLDAATSVEDASRLKKGVAVCRAGDSSEYKTELDFITANFRRTKAGQPTYSDAERAACLDGIAAIARYLDENEEDLAARLTPHTLAMARLRVFSLSTYVGVLRRAVDNAVFDADMPKAIQTMGQGIAYGDIDRARFVIYNAERAFRFPRQKIFHWMHNWHAFRHASETGPIPGEVGIPRTTMSVGEHIADEGGSSVVTIGVLVPCDSGCVEPEKSLEPAFSRYFGNKPGLIDLRHPGAAAALPLDIPGALYANFHKFGFSGVVLDRQFDGIFYIPRTKTTRQ